MDDTEQNQRARQPKRKMKFSLFHCINDYLTVNICVFKGM